VHVVALLEDQLKVALLPLVTLEGLALKFNVGAVGVDTETVADCVADPPGPVQVAVYFVVALSGKVT
jgi:hypothetical protein